MHSFLQFYQAYLNGGSSAQGFADAFEKIADEDKLWMLWILKGKKPNRLITKKELRNLALKQTEIPEWLYAESYRRVGDIEHTVSAILPAQPYTLQESIVSFMLEYEKFVDASLEEKKAWILAQWGKLDRKGISFFNKLICSSLRIKMTHLEISEGIGLYLKRNGLSIMHRIKADFDPRTTSFEEHFEQVHADDTNSKPHLFSKWENLEEVNPSLIKNTERMVYEFDGLECQLIKRAGKIFLWTANDLVTEYFPQLNDLNLPDGTVLEGRLIFKKGERIQSASIFQEILMGRKLKDEKLQLLIVVENILEYSSQNVESKNIQKLLFEISAQEQKILVAESIDSKNLKEIESIVESMRLHQAQAIRFFGKNNFRLPAPKLFVDTVLVYAQRTWSNLYDTLSFAVWKDGELVTLTRTSFGLDEEELAKMTAWVKAQDGDRIGPVRMVEPSRVFQLSLDKIEESSRTKSGLKIINPRIEKEYLQAKKEHVFSLEQVRALLPKT